MKRRENWFLYPEDLQHEPEPADPPLSRWEWSVIGWLGACVVVSAAVGLSLR